MKLMLVMGLSVLISCGGEESPFLSQKESLKIDSINTKKHIDEMEAFTDSVIKAHRWKVDSAIYYFIRNHDCYYKAVNYGLEGNKRLSKIYGDSCDYYNNLLQKIAK